MQIDQALTDPRIFGAALGAPDTWSIWLTVLKAAFGLELDQQQRQAFHSVAGNRQPPTQRVRELWCIVGRRGGKSRVAAAIACYCALFNQHRLAPGEKGMVLVIAASLDQAKVVFEYVKGFFEASPALSREVANITRNEVTLTNGIIIAVHSNSFRTVRGRTVLATVFDEVSFWRDDQSATPDIEVYRAVMPAMANTNGMLIAISTPYRKVGLMFQKHRDYFGIDDPDHLVVQGASKTFNPNLSDSSIANQRQADPVSAASEWDAEFRTDISAYLDDEILEQAIDHSRPLELAPDPRQWYQAFVDPAGGGQSITADAYSIAIGHRNDAGHFVIDVCRGTRGNYDPQLVTSEYAALCREYNIGTVYGDAYAAQWVAGSWQSENIVYEKSELPKSQLYLECLPLSVAA